MNIHLLLLLATCAHASNITTTEDPSSPDPTAGKHESLDECWQVELNPDEFEILANGSALVPAYNRTFAEEFYILEGELLLVCGDAPDDPEEEEEEVNPLGGITFVGMVVSVFCLLLHLIVFVCVPQRRNLPSWNLASLCLALFLSYLCMVVSSVKDGFVGTDFCWALGALQHFFLLSSFLWMSVISLDLFRSILRSTGRLRAPPEHFQRRKFALQSTAAWGGAAAFVAAALASDAIDGVPERMRPAFRDSCWFANQEALIAFFAGPVCFFIAANFFLFAASARAIFANRMPVDSADSGRSELRRNHVMYFRLAAIMGVTWVVGAVAPWAPPEVRNPWLLMLSAALNCFQGLFIFLGFTCNAKVKMFFANKWKGVGPKKSSDAIPTFKSYCYYSNSNEKNLDAVVDDQHKNTLENGVTLHI